MEQMDQKWEDFTREVRTYLDSNDTTNKIHEMRGNGKSRLVVSFDQLRQKHPNIVPIIMKEPLKAFRIFEEQLQAVVKDLGGGDKMEQAKRQVQQNTQDQTIYRVTFEGNLGSHLVTPRGLTSKLVNSYVGVQGIVTVANRVRPKLLKSVHYCEATGKPLTKEYADKNLITDQIQENWSSAVPLHDEMKNP